MDRFLSLWILKSPINILIVLLIYTGGMLALAAIFPVVLGGPSANKGTIPSPSKSTGN